MHGEVTDDVVGEEGREGEREDDGGVYNTSVNGWNGRARATPPTSGRGRGGGRVGLQLRDGWGEGAAAEAANNGSESDFISERIDRH